MSLSLVSLPGLEAQARPPKVVRDSLFHAESVYLAAQPANVAAAQAIVATVERFGRSSLLTRVRAHELLLDYGAAHRDRALVQREATQLIALVHLMTPQELQVPTYGGDALVMAYGEVMVITQQDHPDSMLALARRFQDEIHRPGWTVFLAVAGRPDLSAASVDIVKEFLVGLHQESQ